MDGDIRQFGSSHDCPRRRCGNFNLPHLGISSCMFAFLRSDTMRAWQIEIEVVVHVRFIDSSAAKQLLDDLRPIGRIAERVIRHTVSAPRRTSFLPQQRRPVLLCQFRFAQQGHAARPRFLDSQKFITSGASAALGRRLSPRKAPHYQWYGA